MRRLFSTLVRTAEAQVAVPTAHSGRGLLMRPNVEYPEVVARMMDMIVSSPRTEQLAAALEEIDEPRKGALLMRHFTMRDDLGNAFRVAHALKSTGLEIDRETYRYLMFGCCKYSDVELGLFVMEQMLYDNRPDFRSFKRLFDVCAAQVDLRLWVAYDVMSWFYPIKGFTQNALKTTAFITEWAHVIRLGPSSRAGRGFVTLPNPRGEPYDPFVTMFEDDDPNYGELDGATKERLRLIPQEFEDRNHMAKIVARNRARQVRGEAADEDHVRALEASHWAVEGVRAVVKAELGSEEENMQKVAVQVAKKLEFDNASIPSLKLAIAKAWRERRKKKYD
jgi:hypothetical protein